MRLSHIIIVKKGLLLLLLGIGRLVVVSSSLSSPPPFTPPLVVGGQNCKGTPSRGDLPTSRDGHSLDPVSPPFFFLWFFLAFRQNLQVTSSRPPFFIPQRLPEVFCQHVLHITTAAVSRL